MVDQAPDTWIAAENHASRRLAQLAHVRSLVGEIAGKPAVSEEQTIDRSARIGAAYDAALPIAQKRFDTLAAETAAWAAAAAQALLDTRGNPEACPAPAACLATELEKAERRMEHILGL